ncbi:hypothetical protein QLX08_004781 [Tetragonisca angustula]|uniref:Uncharacterized protein n=1 Tax=Tetragonisca angustula TaxID=166442 RepID=A0AAW1A2P6_9HYME
MANQQEEFCLDGSCWTSYQRDMLYDLFSMYACLTPSVIENALALYRPYLVDGDILSKEDYDEDEEDEEDEDEEEEEVEYGCEGIDSGIDDEDDENDKGGACQLVVCQGVRVT